MPLWAPPTPPQDDEDVYYDSSIGFLYSFRPIPEALLPAVWVAPKKPKDTVPAKPGVFPDESTDKKGGSQVKVHRRDEPIFAPRSLFDRPSPAVAKLRRDYKLQKLNLTNQSRLYTPPMSPSASSALIPVGKTQLGPGSVTFPVSVPASKLLTTTSTPSTPTDLLEWLSSEDYALLQALTHLLELPLNLMVVNLSQTPNWDLACEVVNMASRTNRSVKQCRQRYDHVVLPREEGKIVVDSSPKKKKMKSFIKISPPSPTKSTRLKTAQLVSTDNNQTFKSICFSKFDGIKSISARRTAALVKPVTFTPNITRVTKQSSIFLEHGINFEVVQSATSIASARHERMMAERAKMIQAQRAAMAAEQVKVSSYQSLLSKGTQAASDTTPLHAMIFSSVELGAGQTVSVSNSGTITSLPSITSTGPINPPATYVSAGSSGGIVITGTQSAAQRTAQSILQQQQQIAAQASHHIQVQQGNKQQVVLNQGHSADPQVQLHQLSSQAPVSQAGLMVLAPSLTHPTSGTTIAVTAAGVTYAVASVGTLPRQSISTLSQRVAQNLFQQQQLQTGRQAQANRRISKQVLLNPHLTPEAQTPSLTPTSVHQIHQLPQRMSTGGSQTMILSSSTTQAPSTPSSVPPRLFPTSAPITTSTSDFLGDWTRPAALPSQHIHILHSTSSASESQPTPSLQIHQMSHSVLTSSHASPTLVRTPSNTQGSATSTSNMSATSSGSLPLVNATPLLPLGRSSVSSLNQRVAQTILEQQRQIQAGLPARPIHVYSHSTKQSQLPSTTSDLQTHSPIQIHHGTQSSSQRHLTSSGLNFVPVQNLQAATINATSIQNVGQISGVQSAANSTLSTSSILQRSDLEGLPDSVVSVGTSASLLSGLSARPGLQPSSQSSPQVQIHQLVSHAGQTSLHGPNLVSSTSELTLPSGSLGSTSHIVSSSTGLMTFTTRPTGSTMSSRLNPTIRQQHLQTQQIQQGSHGKVLLAHQGAGTHTPQHILVTHAGQTMVFAQGMSQASSISSVLTTVPSSLGKTSLMIPARSQAPTTGVPHDDEHGHSHTVKNFRERMVKQQPEQTQQLPQQSQVHPTKIVIAQQGQGAEHQMSPTVFVTHGQTMILTPSHTQVSSAIPGITIPLTSTQSSIMFPARPPAPGVMSLHGQGALPLNQKGQQTILLQQQHLQTAGRPLTSQTSQKILITPQTQTELQQLQQQPIQVHSAQQAQQRLVGQGAQTMILSPSMSIVAVRSAQGIRVPPRRPTPRVNYIDVDARRFTLIVKPRRPKAFVNRLQLVKQQLVAGKSVTRPVSDADLQLFLKQHGYTQQTARVAVSLPVASQSQSVPPLAMTVPMAASTTSTTTTLTTSTNVASSTQPVFQTGRNGPMMYFSVPTTTSS